MVLGLLIGLSIVVAPAELELIDRVVAIVDEEPILLSDLQRVADLVRSTPISLETAGAPDDDLKGLQRHALDRLINQTLRAREAERHDLVPVAAEVVDAQLATIRAAVSASTFDDEPTLRRVLERQLRVMRYIEERLAPRVVVDSEEVRRYYDDTLRTELVGRGELLPPLEDVAASIRDLLHESKLNDEIEAWTARLRARADIVDLLETPQGDLPPVVQRWTVGGGEKEP